MTAKQLPARPNLDQLKRQAKDLLQRARSHEAPALARFRALPAFASQPDEALARAALALHDAQSVLAREYGFPSWNALRERVEELTLELDGALAQFLEAATDGRPDRAERLLALHPGIATANLYSALVLGDAAGIDARLAQDPSLATRPGGPRGWQPLHYVCHSALAQRPSRAEGLVAIARRLLALGADPNLRFPWPHHGVHRPVLWGATRVTRLLPLAALLLEAGANPNDGVTLTLAASAGDLPVLELLCAHGADVNHPWASDGAAPLYAILGWSKTAEGARWLLSHGADPNAVFAENGETPLHAAARGWDLSLVQALVAHGADASRAAKDGRTPHAVAALNGNPEVADWLAAHGVASALSLADQLTAACARGDRATAKALLAQHPELPRSLAAEHYVAFHRAAERNDPTALALMLECGFDPDRPDESIGKTALHSAAMAGAADAVRVLLAHGASLSARDREFHGQPLVWAAEGARSSGDPDRAYATIGRMLIDAGSPLGWEGTAEPSEGLLEIISDWRPR